MIPCRRLDDSVPPSRCFWADGMVISRHTRILLAYMCQFGIPDRTNCQFGILLATVSHAIWSATSSLRSNPCMPRLSVSHSGPRRAGGSSARTVLRLCNLLPGLRYACVICYPDCDTPCVFYFHRNRLTIRRFGLPCREMIGLRVRT